MTEQGIDLVGRVARLENLVANLLNRVVALELAGDDESHGDGDGDGGESTGSPQS